MKGKLWRKIVAGVLVGLLILSLIASLIGTQVAGAETVGASSTLGLGPALTESPITSGAVNRTYSYAMQRASGVAKALVNVIEVDLKNPNVKLDLMTGKAGQLTGRSTVLQMTKDNTAVAGINADLFNMGATGLTAFGGSIANGQLVTSQDNTMNGWYTFGITKDRKPVIDVYGFNGTLVAPDTSVFPIQAVNQEGYYYTDPADGKMKHHYRGKIYMFTSAWGKEVRGNVDGLTPTEMMVVNGVVTQIAKYTTFKGLVPKDAVVFSAEGPMGEALFSKFKVGDAVKINTDFVPTVATNPTKVEDFQMMVGGHSILVDGGVVVPFSLDVKGVSGTYERARTGVGYNVAMDKVYLVTVNKNDISAGMTLAEFQRLMVDLGCLKAMNLDGGGSTTVVTRPLGQFVPTLTQATEFGSLRPVMNGIGVFSLAPKGELAGIGLRGPTTMLIGEKATYSLVGFDTYYNPVDVAALKPVWTFDPAFGTLTGTSMTATKAGVTTVSAVAGSQSKAVAVKVLGAADLKSLVIETTAKAVDKGAKLKVAVYATAADGAKRKVPTSALTWTFAGMKASVVGDVVTVESIDEGAQVGQLVARYDGFISRLNLPVPNKETGVGTVWENFNAALKYTVTPEYLPSTVKGTVGVVGGALQLAYDFTNADHTTVLYATLNGAAGVAVPGAPVKMQVGVLGDQSNNAIRAEIVDATGKLAKVDIATTLDWTGWKTVDVDLSPYALKAPLTLKRVYVFDWGDGKLDRNKVGTVALDDWSWIYAGGTSVKPVTPKPTPTPSTAKSMKLQVGSVAMTLNGVASKLDAAPVLVGGATYVPLAVVSKGFGGAVTWDAVKKQVTVKSGTKLLVFTLGSKSVTVNGVVQTMAAAPFSANGRTMVPLRAISELLGLQVAWNAVDKSILLK
jgi:hypothetical protein